MSETKDIIKALKSEGVKNTDTLIKCLVEIIDDKDSEIKCYKNLCEAYKKQFHIFLDSELKTRANQNQKAIECLKEVREKLYKSAIQVVGTGVNAVRLYSINKIFNNKIKELEKQNDTTR